MVRALMGELPGRTDQRTGRLRIAGYSDRKIRELYPQQRDLPASRQGRRDRSGDRDSLVPQSGDREAPSRMGVSSLWRGLAFVPKQRSSGSRARTYSASVAAGQWRPLSTHPADPRRSRAALGQRFETKRDPRSLWLGKMRQRRHPNVVAVALANKNARIAWSLLTSDTVYDASLSVGAA